MQSRYFLNKGLVVGIIVLFVGVALTPGIYAQAVQQKDEFNDEYQLFLKIKNSPEINQLFIDNLKEKENIFRSIDLSSYKNQPMKSRCLDCILSEELKNHPFVTELERVIKESPSLQQDVQQLSVSDKTCDLLLHLFFISASIATFVSDASKLLFPIWFTFISIALLSIALFKILGCPLPPVP